MITQSIYFCCMTLAWAILTSGGIGHAADSTQPPTNRALLIGINQQALKAYKW